MGTEGAPVLDQLGEQFPLIEPQSLAGTASLGLPATLESVRSARDFTSLTLRRWQLGELYDAVTLVVSELVTNALRHGMRMATAGVPGETGLADVGERGEVRGTVQLELLRSTRRLVCAVHDPGTSAPHQATADASAESGRGLHLVECFSDGWGWRPMSGGRHGKVVWASFRIG